MRNVLYHLLLPVHPRAVRAALPQHFRFHRREPDGSRREVRWYSISCKPCNPLPETVSEYLAEQICSAAARHASKAAVSAVSARDALDIIATGCSAGRIGLALISHDANHPLSSVPGAVGAIALVDLPRGTFIGVYSGVLIPSLRRRFFRGDWTYDMEAPRLPHTHVDYTFQASRVRGVLSGLNDYHKISASPNVSLVPVVLAGVLPLILAFTCEDVKRGQEVTIKYGPAWYKRFCAENPDAKKVFMDEAIAVATGEKRLRALSAKAQLAAGRAGDASGGAGRGTGRCAPVTASGSAVLSDGAHTWACPAALSFDASAGREVSSCPRSEHASHAAWCLRMLPVDSGSGLAQLHCSARAMQGQRGRQQPQRRKEKRKERRQRSAVNALVQEATMRLHLRTQTVAVRTA